MKMNIISEVINMARKEREFNFICVNEPDEDCLDRFHTAIAKELIKKHGIETIRKVLETIAEEKAE